MTEAQTRSSDTAGPVDGSARRFTLDLPMMSIEVRPRRVHLPHVSMPRLPVPRINRQEMGHAADVARSMLPPPERVAYYGALGAMAVMGVIEWPVAAAIGAGAIIAQRARTGESSFMGGIAGGATARESQATRAAAETVARAASTARTSPATRGRSGTSTRARSGSANSTPSSAAAAASTTRRGAASPRSRSVPSGQKDSGT
ncbi:hypothetical protein ACIBG4_14320 [Nonomuraea sp. NPDC050383]|uniref:hypothetical protein n=1 Tax=Nonomuraea sp. NPDC050383 TaxID=3364362 RepID=UPI00379212D6